MKHPARALVFVAAVVVTAFAARCARPARSEPLSVTYYYLPD